MDPNQALKEIMQLANGLADYDPDIQSAEDNKKAAFEGAMLAEKVKNLNDWLSNAGFLPNDWKYCGEEK